VTVPRIDLRNLEEWGQAMTTTERRLRAIRFLENFNTADPAVFEELITENFRFEIVSGIPEFPPIEGRAKFAAAECATLKRLFPEGLQMRLETVIAEGLFVAATAAADTIAMNGRRYPQRYNFFLRFEGDLIAEGREYNDTNLVREVFLT
jgi:ketosteroid isomerase-like protein